MKKSFSPKIEKLLKKIEALEDQSFAQKLLIDELDGKLDNIEKRLKVLEADKLPSINIPKYTPHVCSASVADVNGNIYCSICGSLMSIDYKPFLTPSTSSTITVVHSYSSADLDEILKKDDHA